MRELIFTLSRKDFEMQFFRGSGNGGQNRNKVSSACRIVHPASGAVGEAREERDQHVNRRVAFKRLSEHPKFKLWVQRRIYEIETGETIDQWVERQMDENNLKIEYLDV